MEGALLEEAVAQALLRKAAELAKRYYACACSRETRSLRLQTLLRYSRSTLPRRLHERVYPAFCAHSSMRHQLLEVPPQLLERKATSQQRKWRPLHPAGDDTSDADETARLHPP